MPPAEQRMLLLLLGLAVAGQGVKYLINRPDQAPGGVELLASLAPGSPSAQRNSAIHQGRPLGDGERINVDSAPAAELARLPRVGPRLAKTIVKDREAHGPFGTVQALDRVPGIGPGLLGVLAPHLRFSSAAIPLRAASRLNLNSATLRELDALPGIGASRAAAIVSYREAHGPFASVEELSRVPGLTPSALRRLDQKVGIQ